MRAAQKKTSRSAPEEQSSTWYDAKYFAKPDPITDIAETVDTDVVVVGAGNGGLVVGASVVDAGGKLILVEKNAMWITWAGEMGAYNTKLMKDRAHAEEMNRHVDELMAKYIPLADEVFESVYGRFN